MADLTTLQDVKDQLGMSGTSSADDILATLITASSKWVETQIGRTFGVRTVTDTRDGDDTDRLLLLETPVNSVTSVTVDGDVIPARTTVTGDGWVLADDGVTLVGYTFTEGVQNVVIVYSAGETVPADLKQAVTEHVAIRYRDRGREGIAMSAGGGEAVTYTAHGGSLAFINSVLDSYRRFPMA